MSNLDYGTDPSRELAQWLQEAARRRYAMYSPPPRRSYQPAPRKQPPKKWGTARNAIGLGGLAAAYFQYYMIDVMLQIASMPSVTVFV